MTNKEAYAKMVESGLITQLVAERAMDLQVNPTTVLVAAEKTWNTLVDICSTLAAINGAEVIPHNQARDLLRNGVGLVIDQVCELKEMMAQVGVSAVDIAEVLKKAMEK
jgi:hypothetical protein